MDMYECEQLDAVHSILKDLVHKSISETAELKQYPSLRAEVMNVACESLDKMRNESKRATIQMFESQVIGKRSVDGRTNKKGG